MAITSPTRAPNPRVAFYESHTSGEPAWLWCKGRVEVLHAERPEEIISVLTAVERGAKEGLYAAGFVAYEAAPEMDDACSTYPRGELPLAWFALFREMVRHERAGIEPGEDFRIGDWRPSIPLTWYEEAIGRIKRYIARGDTYQVNYTFRLRSPFCGDAWELFLRLCQAQQARHGAFLDIGRHVICSASPELFFSLDGETVACRPMKGTAPRGLTFREDEMLRSALGSSVKDRAENAMVVDMVGNDIGRIARPGSVRVESAFDVAAIPRFELLETLLYEDGTGWFLLTRHLQRLSQSAAYFDFAIDLDSIQKQLDDLAGSLSAGPQRVRLRVGRRGEVTLEATPLSSLETRVPLRLILAGKPIDADNVFLYHKTAQREVYDSRRTARTGCDDVVLWNPQGYVTETTIANLVVEKRGRLVTPRVACGLLSGVFREHLLEAGIIAEDVVTIDDLRRSPRVFAINSVRRWMPAVLQE